MRKDGGDGARLHRVGRMGRSEGRHRGRTYLRERKETLRDGDDILHLLNRLDAVLDDLGVLGPGRVEDVADTLDVALGPVPVGLLHRLSRTAVSVYANGGIATRRRGTQRQAGIVRHNLARMD